MSESVIDQEEYFWETYKPELNKFYDNPEDCSFGGCMYETYGEEVEYVRQVAIANPRRVWTIIDGDGESLWYIAGMKFVNRLGYLVTEGEWQDEHEQYQCV